MKLVCFLLLIAAAPCVKSQQPCEEVEVQERWTEAPTDVTLVCLGISSPRWWIVPDLCQASDAMPLASCQSSVCSVSSEVYSNLTACVVCCTDSGDTSFSLDPESTCFRIRVCPQISVYAPPIALTGSTIEVMTFVATKPPPPIDSVVVTIENSVPEDVPIESRDAIYPAPVGRNNYTFVHTVHVPASSEQERDSLLFDINFSRVPHGTCSGRDNVQFFTNLLRVNSSSASTTTQGSTMVSTGGINTGGSAPFSLDAISMVIGIFIGAVVAILLGGGGIILVVCVRAAVRTKKMSLQNGNGQHGGTGTSRPLLTVNGTPATTPNYELQRTLGQSPSNTPASTPTEQELQLASHGQSAADANPYQEIGHAHARTPPEHSVQSTLLMAHGPAQPPQMTVGAGVGHLPPPPREPYVPNPPGPPGTFPPSTLPIHQTNGTYHTQGEAMKLSEDYEHEQGHMV